MKKITRITDPGTIAQARFADEAGVDRVALGGIDLLPIGALGTAVKVEQGSPVLVFNSAGSIAYVSFGAYNMAAPAGPTDGIPIAAGEKYMLNSGSNAWIRASAATVYGYKGDN